ncbi:MAG: sigma-70 family RNA polymerase sigma factor [Planctomycetota bacterium]
MGQSSTPHPELHEMLQRCQGRLLARIRWMLGERARQTAETADFLAWMSIKLLESADHLRWHDETHFLNLATRVARHQLVDRQRRHRAERFVHFTTALGLATTDTAPEAELEGDEQVDHLLAALESLPANYQRVIELRHFDEMSFADIAATMGGTENSVEILHRRAVAKLGRLLGPRSDLGEA